MKYFLVCMAFDGDYVIEKDRFNPQGYDSIEAAWDRNEEMGSRWFFFPFRVVVDESNHVVSAADGYPTVVEGMNLDEFKNFVPSNYDLLT